MNIIYSYICHCCRHYCSRLKISYNGGGVAEVDCGDGGDGGEVVDDGFVSCGGYGGVECHLSGAAHFIFHLVVVCGDLNADDGDDDSEEYQAAEH